MSSSLHRFIPLDLPSDPALSRAQKRFSSLLKKVDRQRAELQAWETKEAVFARGWARHVAPFRAQQAAGVVEVIDRLDALAARQALSELDLATLESELCDMVETVLAEGVLDEDECQRLEALFDHYSGVSLQAIHAEEEADFKAQVLDEVGLDLGDEDIDLNDPGALLEGLPDASSTPELQVPLAEGENAALVQALRERGHFEGAEIITVDGLRVEYPDGFGLVRASNTTPVLVLRFEADDAAALARIQQAVKAALLAIRPDLSIPF